MEDYYNILAEAYEAEDNFWKELWEELEEDYWRDYGKENYFEIQLIIDKFENQNYKSLKSKNYETYI